MNQVRLLRARYQHPRAVGTEANLLVARDPVQRRDQSTSPRRKIGQRKRRNPAAPPLEHSYARPGEIDVDGADAPADLRHLEPTLRRTAEEEVLVRRDQPLRRSSLPLAEIPAIARPEIERERDP